MWSYLVSISTISSFFSGFQQHPTYDLLAAYGITPSNQTTYPLTKIQDALKAQTGAIPYLGCSSNASLSEVWYFGHVYGTVSVGSALTTHFFADLFEGTIRAFQAA
jgi:ribonuclease T2